MEETVRKIVATKKAAGLAEIRKKLDISLERAASLLSSDSDATGSYFRKENGLCAMTVEEYTAIMLYFKEIKLRQIFGANYKEKQA